MTHVCVHVCVREREDEDRFKCDGGALTSFKPFLFSFTSTQPSMDTLGEQLATMPCVLVVDVIIQ